MLRTHVLGFALVAVGCADAARPVTPADWTDDTTSENRPASKSSGPSFETDSWALGEGALDGYHAFVRVRTGLERFAGDSAYPTRVEVVAEFISPLENGIPRPDDARALDPIEDEIVRQFEGGRVALLAAVITGNGARTYILMSKRPKVEREFASVRAHAAGRPIHLRVERDPEWTRFRTLHAAMRQSLEPR